MKKNVFLVALLAMGLTTFTACDEENNEKTIPEGIADVNFEEDQTAVTDANLTNWVQYSVQVANLLTKDASDLKNAWTDSYNGGDAYSEQFKNPGTGKTFASYSNCVQQIIEGCADIANEVGTAKIGEPRDLWEKGSYKDAVYAVESWYSFHSIDDYTNNILSIRNAVYGTRNGEQAAQSVASYLKPTMCRSTTASSRKSTQPSMPSRASRAPCAATSAATPCWQPRMHARHWRRCSPTTSSL